MNHGVGLAAFHNVSLVAVGVLGSTLFAGLASSGAGIRSCVSAGQWCSRCWGAVAINSGEFGDDSTNLMEVDGDAYLLFEGKC